MSKNYDIETVSKLLVTGSATIIGSSVAVGMKRYVTFLQVSPVKPGGNDGSQVYMASTATSPGSGGASTITKASAAQKMVATILSGNTTAQSLSIPATPDTEHPLFTVAAGKYLSAFASTTPGLSSPVNLFVQYYDE